MANVVQEDYSFKPSGSVNELKDFQNSHIWQDIVKYINFHLEGNQAVLETSTEEKFIYRSQGAVIMAKDLLDLPTKMVEWAEDDNLLAGDNND